MPNTRTLTSIHLSLTSRRDTLYWPGCTYAHMRSRTRDLGCRSGCIYNLLQRNGHKCWLYVAIKIVIAVYTLPRTVTKVTLLYTKYLLHFPILLLIADNRLCVSFHSHLVIGEVTCVCVHARCVHVYMCVCTCVRVCVCVYMCTCAIRVYARVTVHQPS